jgi:hypothetical protein
MVYIMEVEFVLTVSTTLKESIVTNVNLAFIGLEINLSMHPMYVSPVSVTLISQQEIVRKARDNANARKTFCHLFVIDAGITYFYDQSYLAPGANSSNFQNSGEG